MQIAFEECRGRLEPPSGALTETIASLPSNLRLYEGLGYRVLSSHQYSTGTDADITLGKDLASHVEQALGHRRLVLRRARAARDQRRSRSRSSSRRNVSHGSTSSTRGVNHAKSNGSRAAPRRAA